MSSNSKRPKISSTNKTTTTPRQEETTPRQNNKKFQIPLPKRESLVGVPLVCGLGDCGQLGLGEDVLEQSCPTPLNGVDQVVDVCAGGIHTLLLTTDGRVYSFGCNDEGALGRKIGSESKPLEVRLPEKVTRMSAGDSHSAVLLEDGSVFAWGTFRNSHGSMGLTAEGSSSAPFKIPLDEKCCAIASGCDHLVMLTCSGKVFTMGCGENGQLGRITKRSMTGESRRGTKQQLQPLQVIVKGVKDIDSIWATDYATFVRDAETKSIWAFGLNNYRQLASKAKALAVPYPVKTDLTDIKQIAGGQHHTLALKNDGSCYAIGRHDYGRLGLGDLSENVTKLLRITKLPNDVIQISCNDGQSFAVTASGQLWTWGIKMTPLDKDGHDAHDILEPVWLQGPEVRRKRVIRVSNGSGHSVCLANMTSHVWMAHKATNAPPPKVEPIKKAAAKRPIDCKAPKGANKKLKTEEKSPRKN